MRVEDEAHFENSLKKSHSEAHPQRMTRQESVGEKYTQDTVGKETLKIYKSKDNAGELEAQMKRQPVVRNEAGEIGRAELTQPRRPHCRVHRTY